MKKVKTLIAVFICMFCSALLGACSCAKATVSVVSIKVSATSDNLIYDEANDKYLIRQGETFTITYELGPENSSDKTVYVNVTPANKIACDTPIINTNSHTNEVMFEASTVNSGDTIIEFETKDNGKKTSITVEVVGNLTPISKPINVKYDEATSSFTWDKASVTTENGTFDANKYELVINDTERFTTDTNSLKMNLDSGVDYFVKVKAVGELATRTADSDYSTDVRFYVAKTVGNFRAIDGELKWDYSDSKNISNFRLNFGQDRSVAISPSETSFPFAEYVHGKGYEDVNYPVSITALNKDYVNGATDPETGVTTYILNSRSNPQITLTKLTSPQNVKITTSKEAGSIFNSSVLTWNNVTNASHYEIKITKKGEVNPTHVDEMKVGTDINLSQLLESSGEYTVEIKAKGNVNSTFSSDEYSKTTLDFVVIPTLTGSINYSNNTLNVNTSDLIDLLGLTTGEINKLDYEFFYSISGTGNYTNVLTMQGAQSINLSEIMNVDSEFYVLVRPIPTARYSGKNVVVIDCNEVDENKTINHMISQLRPVEVKGVNNDGILTVVDINSSEKVDKYRFELFDGSNTLVQYLYREKITFDTTDTTKFTISIVDLFNIQDVKNYTVKVVPMSDTVIDANSDYTPAFTFAQLGSINIDSVVIDDNEITWGAVANYHSYLVSINDQPAQEVETNRFEITNMSVLTDNNTIKIQVIGNNQNAISGDVVTISKGRAKAVSNVYIIDGVLTWDHDVANSTYFVNITYPLGNTDKVECNTNTFDGLDKITESATITIVRVISTAFNSVESSEYVIERLSAPDSDLTLENNTYNANFTKNENAFEYRVNIYKNTTLEKYEILSTSGSKPTATIDGDKVKFTIPTLDAGRYNIYIQCLPADQNADDYELNNKYYLMSEPSGANEIVVYPQVEVVSKTNTLRWGIDTTYELKDFVIKFTDSENEDIVLAETNYAFNELESGTYNITINATSRSANVVYASPLAVTITKVATPVLEFKNNVITFKNIENASGYRVYNQNNELLTADEDYTLSIVGENIEILPKGINNNFVYGIYVVAVGTTDVIDGNKSNIVSYKKIGATSNVVFTTDGADKVFTWQPVENNAGYNVIIKDKTNSILSNEVVNTNTYKIPSRFITGNQLFSEGTYTFEIVVIGGKEGDINLLNSDTTTANFIKLDTVSNIQMRNDVVTWTYAGDGVPEKYVLKILTRKPDYEWEVKATYEVAHVSGSTLQFDLSQITEYDNYKIEFTTIGTDETYSINSEAFRTSDPFVKLSTPTFSFTDGVLSFDEIVDARTYEVYDFDGTNYNLLTSEYTLTGDRKLVLRDAGVTYSIVIRAIATNESGKLNSPYSEVVKINKLTSINDFLIDANGDLKWSIVDNASGYVIHNLTNDGVNSPLAGGETQLIGYEELYLRQGLSLGDSCEFKIQAVGTLNSQSGVYYLNSDLSNVVTINAVNNVDAETLTLNNGVVSWEAVDGVSSYKIDIYEKASGSYTHIKTLTSNTTFIDFTNVEQIVAGKDIVARITPFTTNNNSYVILQDKTQFAEIGFYRYNTIKSLAIENGLIKLTINISAVTTSDLAQILNCVNYGELSQEIAQKYFGHYNFKVNVKGFTTLNITLKDMINLKLDVIKQEVYAYYELAYEVATTRQLELSISAVGNSGDATTTYNAISSFPKNITAYKYSAPKPTANENLVSTSGAISFRKIHNADGSFATKYVLRARSGEQQLFYIIQVPASEDSQESYSIADVSKLTYSYYNEGGTVSTTNIEYNKEYIFTLTTLGTESGTTGDLYLRSNTYASISITFLADTSALSYKFNTGDINGGHLSWQANTKCLSYTMFLLNSVTANELYGANSTTVKANSSWIDAAECVKIELDSTTTEYLFENSTLPSGNYWVAIIPNGNGINFITAPRASQTLDIYKLNSVVNAQLRNGTFMWETRAIDDDYIVGYKIIVTIYSEDGELKEILQRGQLVTTKSYTLEEVFVDHEGNTHELKGVDEGGLKEKYGVSVIAIGGFINQKQCVSSFRSDINNSGAGYARLDKVVVSINQTQRLFEWTTSQTGNISEYYLYNNDTLMTGEKIVNRYISFNDLTTAGDYPLEVIAVASGNEYLNSLRSDIITIIKYYPPEVAIDNGVLVWQSEQNGINLTPYGSTVAIYQSGTLLHSEVVTEFSYVMDNRFGKGEYVVKVKFNDNQTVDTYSIASEEREILVYKLDTPSIQPVDNYSGEKECEVFDSAIKWQFIKDKNGNKIQKYTVKFSVYNGEIFEIDESLTKVYDHANYSSEYFFVDGDYMYFNISNLGDIVTSRVRIIVVAEGNSITNEQINSAINNSQSYDAIVNSSEGAIDIDYSIGKPTNASSDTINGIIRWGGSENPVLITLEHYATGPLSTDKVYISSEYIEKYGKVYYLPYMTTYKSVQLQFVIGGTYVSNTLELSVSTQNLFSSGMGTEEDPYIIENAQQFMNLQYRPLSYLQVKEGVEEINLTSTWTMLNSFEGHLSGYVNGTKTTQINGVSGQGISIVAKTEGSTVYSSLFKTLSSGASIKNITFNIGSNIAASNGGPYTNSINMSAVAITNYGLIENVAVKGSYVGYTRNTINFGGVVVDNYGIIRNVTTATYEAKLKSQPTSSTSTSSYLKAGGISYANYNVIDGCISSITINLGENTEAKNRKASGITYQNNGVVLNSDFAGRLISWDMAGIVYENYYTTNTVNYTRNYIEASEDVEISVDYNGGSVIGCSSVGTFSLYTAAKTSSNVYVGGIVAINNGGKIGRCYSIMTNACDMDMTGFYTTGSTMPYIGGIVGFNQVASIGEVVYPVVEHSYSIVTAKFIEPSSKLQSGSIVGGYGSTIGSDIDYSANDYGLYNVLTYSADYSPIYGVIISNNDIVRKLGSISEFMTLSSEEFIYATQLNSVVSGDTTYNHSREFVGGDTHLILQLNKTISE